MLSLAVLLVLLAIRRVAAPFGVERGWRPLAFAVLAIGAALGLIAYPAVAVWYAADPHFFDNAEPSMTAIGWLFHVGLPVYHQLDSPERYAHIYGPLAFVSHGVVLGIFGPRIGASKWLGVGAALASLVLLYFALRDRTKRFHAVTLVGGCALVLLCFRNYSFWTRPEPLQLLAVSASTLFAVARPGWTTTVGLGIASGFLWNLKFTGPLYSLPIFVLFQHRTGWRRTVAALAIAAGAAAIPFVIFSNVSLVNYLVWLRLSGRTGLLMSTLRQNLEWALYLGVPLLVSYFAVSPQSRPQGSVWQGTMAALLAGTIGVVVAAAKPGAGPYHLVPFLPIVTYIVAWHISTSALTELTHSPPVALASIAATLTACLIALAQQAQFVTTMAERRPSREIADIEQFVSTHQGVVEMGYGSTEALTLERPVLVFRNNSYMLDQPAVREHQLEGYEIPESTVRAVSRCRVNYWLVPRGEVPFSGRNSYAAVFMRPLFSDDFRRTFQATHEHIGATRYYDVWRCDAAPGSDDTHTRR